MLARPFMILTCPACSARFIVDPAALGARGRMVRCARCRETWHATPSDEEFAAAVPPAEAFPEPAVHEGPPAEPEPPAAWPSFSGDSMPNFLTDSVQTPRLSSNRKALPAIRKPPRSRTKMAAWLIIAALVVALAVLLAVGRSRIVALWPAVEPIYAAFGLSTPLAGTGLELRSVNSAVTPVDGKPTLIVAGRIANVTSQAQKVPTLVVTLRDTRGNLVKSWSLAPSQATLLPGEGMSFQTSMPSPPADATSAVVTFGSLPK
ncbi:MAG TPA: DUF3426 domain-containing protein [Stellaceae bacterium]|nr:DUF3426 domain-containing protein [Stellaceae bacterium]